MIHSHGYYSGHVGQLDAEFAANQDLIVLIREKHKLYDFKGLVKLGIQAPIGTKFVINGQTLRIGATGIYELDLNGLSEITALSFDQKSVQAVSLNNNAYLIVDVIYEDGED